MKTVARRYVEGTSQIDASVVLPTLKYALGTRLVANFHLLRHDFTAGLLGFVVDKDPLKHIFSEHISFHCQL